MATSQIPALTTYDGIADDGDPAITITVMATGIAFGGGVRTITLVDVNDSRGLQQASSVAWELSDNQLVRLSAVGLSPEETLRIAREVTFVDEATWRQLYDVTEFPS